MDVHNLELASRIVCFFLYNQTKHRRGGQMKKATSPYFLMFKSREATKKKKRYGCKLNNENYKTIKGNRLRYIINHLHDMLLTATVLSHTKFDKLKL